MRIDRREFTTGKVRRRLGYVGYQLYPGFIPAIIGTEIGCELPSEFGASWERCPIGRSLRHWISDHI